MARSLLAALLLGAAGCGTATSLRSGEDQALRPYGGVQEDLRAGAALADDALRPDNLLRRGGTLLAALAGCALVADLPLSAAADTALLPLTGPATLAALLAAPAGTGVSLGRPLPLTRARPDNARSP